MPPDAATTDELAPIAPSAVTRAEEIRVGPGAVTPADRARLDSIADWLQDVAYHHLIELGVEDAGFWIVRRTRVRIEAFPRFSELLSVTTAGVGAAHSLAQRRTTISGDAGARIEAVAVWVNVDPATQAPARLSERFLEAFGIPAGPRPRSKLRHEPPPADASSDAWTFRAGDLDIVGHVNNARYWAVFDEVLAADGPPVPLDIEVEHRAAGAAGDAIVRRSGDMAWVTDARGEVLASARLLG